MILPPGIGYYPQIIAQADFTTRNIASGVYALPAFLTLTNSSTNKTVQNSSTTIVSGLGANSARAFSRNGSTFGLLLEASARNDIKNQDLSNAIWVNTSMTIASATDPSGGSSVCSLTDNSGSVAAFIQWSTFSTPATGNKCGSTWRQVVTPIAGTSHSTWNFNLTGFPAFTTTNGVADASFVRWDTTGPVSATSGNIAVNARSLASDTGTTLWAFPQFEDGKYPTSVIINTSGSAVTRNADVLSGTASTFCPGGYFYIKKTFAPMYASTEQSNDHDLFFLDSNNRVFLQQSTKKIVLRIGGVDVLSSALTWSRDTAITVRAIHNAIGRTLVVSGATTGNGTTTDTAVSSISLPGTAYIGGNASGPQESLSLQKIIFYKP